MFVESAVLSVGIALAREATRSSERSVRTWKTADDRLRRAVEYCESHLADDLSLCDVAEVVALSAPHLASLFRTAYGVPPHRWLMGRRVEKARSLLKNPSLTITDVALACGFASSQHFARVFRRFVNTTPTEYRRQCLS
jgi:AraC family transcriptional regulator